MYGKHDEWENNWYFCKMLIKSHLSLWEYYASMAGALEPGLWFLVLSPPSELVEMLVT